MIRDVLDAKYIFTNNVGLDRFKFLFYGVIFQMYKRVLNGTFSITIFNGMKLFLYPNCNISSMYAYTNIPDKKEIQALRKLASENITGKKYLLRYRRKYWIL